MNYSLLIIDDDDDILEVWKMILKDTNITAYYASNGVDARSVIDSKNIDAIISDISMPDGEGVGVIKYVNKLEKINPLFIFMTGVHHFDEDHLIALGADKVFYKTEKFDEILKYISENIRSHN